MKSNEQLIRNWWESKSEDEQLKLFNKHYGNAKSCASLVSLETIEEIFNKENKIFEVVHPDIIKDDSKVRINPSFSSIPLLINFDKTVGFARLYQEESKIFVEITTEISFWKDNPNSISDFFYVGSSVKLLKTSEEGEVEDCVIMSVSLLPKTSVENKS